MLPRANGITGQPSPGKSLSRSLTLTPSLMSCEAKTGRAAPAAITVVRHGRWRAAVWMVTANGSSAGPYGWARIR